MVLIWQNYNHFTGVDYDAKTETNAIFMVCCTKAEPHSLLTGPDPRRRQGMGHRRR